METHFAQRLAQKGLVEDDLVEIVDITLPAADQAVLARRAEIVAALRVIVPGEGVIDAEREMRPFESDGLTAYRQLPMVVVLPETTEQVSEVLKYCHRNNIKVVPRGAGTSLSGGALPLEDGVLLGMSKFSRIREIDFDNRVAVVEPGVTNLSVSNAVAEKGFYYAPDPSSQIACTIGGNVAENSGGVHCLKYGLTVHNVTGIKFMTMDGELVTLGGKALDIPGYEWHSKSPEVTKTAGENWLVTEKALDLAQQIAREVSKQGGRASARENVVKIPVLAIAGSLAAKKTVPASAGTFPTHGGLFIGLLVGVVLIMGGLTFFPSLALGPIVEHFASVAGQTFATGG